jgi:prepilin-type N-terminal cleavage/methylation domain-containing protein
LVRAGKVPLAAHFSLALGEGNEFMSGREEAFSLIELLIVVAIILIIAAIAIPSLLRSKIAANQASAIESLRVIGTSEVTYAATYGNGYSTTLAMMGPATSGALATSSAAGLIDDLLASGAKSGYTFIYTPTLLDSTGRYNGYTVLANPIVAGTTGQNFYYEDETHLIRMNATAPAGSTDSCVAE